VNDLRRGRLLSSMILLSFVRTSVIFVPGVNAKSLGIVLALCF
jgi:hypothetical protein